MGLFSVFKKGGVVPLARSLSRLLSEKAPRLYAGNTATAVKALKLRAQKVADDQKGGHVNGAMLAEKISNLNSVVQLNFLQTLQKVEKKPKTVAEKTLTHIDEGLKLLVEVNTIMLNFRKGEAALELEAMMTNASKRIAELQKRQKKLQTAMIKVATAKRGMLLEKEVVVVKKKMSHALAHSEMKSQAAKKLRMNSKHILDLIVDWEKWNKTPLGKGTRVKIEYKHP